MDIQAAENRKAVYFFVTTFPSNSKKQVKKWVLTGMMVLHISQPLVPCATAIILPIPSVANHRLTLEQNKMLNDKNYYPQIAPIIQEKIDKLQLTTDQLHELNDFARQINEGSITMEEAVLQIRGGDGLIEVLGIIAFFIFVQWHSSRFAVEAFQPIINQNYRGWGTKADFPANYNDGASSTRHQMRKPPTISQDEYSALSKAERRRLPDSRDKTIEIPNRPKLDVGYNQVHYKVKKHGKSHGLPVNSQGKVAKTEANSLALRDSIVEIANDSKTLWYTDGQYQGGTSRSYLTINLYNINRRLIIIFEKRPEGGNKFLTTFELTDVESKHLTNSNGNCLTERAINSQTAVSPNVYNNFLPNNSVDQQSDINTITKIDMSIPINIEQPKNEL